jgi:hypothetical protein
MTFLQLIFTISTYQIHLRPFSPQLSSITKYTTCDTRIYESQFSENEVRFSQKFLGTKICNVILNQWRKTDGYI